VEKPAVSLVSSLSVCGVQ